MTSFKNISLKILLLVTIIFCFVSVSYAEIVCVKKQVKANKKGVVNLTNSVRVESKTCPSGYKLLYNIPKGKKGDTGATGPKGDKGDTGATGPQGPKGDKGDNCTNGNCNTGYEDFCNSNVLESGTVITGNYSSQKSFCPRASQPIRQEDILINYKNQKHPECQGSYENPTAAPGKVCIYNNRNLASYLYYENSYPNNNVNMPQRTIINAYSYEECMEKGLSWQQVGCDDVPGRRIDDDTICRNYQNRSECQFTMHQSSVYSDYPYSYSEIIGINDDEIICGLDINYVSKEHRYWTGSKCLTNFDYYTGKREEVIFINPKTNDRFGCCGCRNNDSSNCDKQDIECMCNSSCYIGYIEFPVWDGISCVTTLTNQKLYAKNDIGNFEPVTQEVCEEGVPFQDSYSGYFYFITDVPYEYCTNFQGCFWTEEGYCYIEQNYSRFSSLYSTDGATWAYTAP